MGSNAASQVALKRFDALPSVTAPTKSPACGDVKKVPSFKVGDFDQGNTKRYTPPRRLTLFNVREGASFPKRYFVTLALAEEDQGGFPDFVNGLFNLAIKTDRKACLIGNRATPGGRFYASIRRAITLQGNASAPV